MSRRKSFAPRTKEELLNRLLSRDFDGDISKLGESTHLRRVAPHIIELSFPEIGKTYELSVRIPRDDAVPKEMPQGIEMWTVQAGGRH